MLATVLRHFLADHALTGQPVMVAVSGGTDSTSLLLALHESALCPLLAAHVNHHLRGAESDEDEAFVRDLAARLSIPFLALDGTLSPALIRSHGIEGAARAVRYEQLKQAMSSRNVAVAATAHQQNDQAETILMRLITNNGVGGLRGIHPFRDDGFVRPLLDVTRRELEQYLHVRAIAARHDSSNDELRFLRNRVRRVVGAMNAVEVRQIAAIAGKASEYSAALDRLLDSLDRSETTPVETRFSAWPEDRWLVQALLHRHIRRLDPETREISAADLKRIAAALPGLHRMTVTRKLELVQRGAMTILRERPLPTPPFELALKPESAVTLPGLGRTIHLRRTASRAGPPYPQHPLRQLFLLSKGAEPAFVVRNRRPGDRFQPLGFPHEKKLKDVLIDRRIEREIRDRLPLLIWGGNIIWIGGVEVSERFRLGSEPGDTYEVWLEDEDRESIPG